MIKKTITYTDYNEVSHTEDFYFNLTKAELTEMNLVSPGGMAVHLQAIVDAQNPQELITVFKEIVIKAYGQKSEDGKRFVKTQELRDEFMQTEAYSELFMELVSDDKAAIAFIDGIIPASVNSKSQLQVQSAQLPQ